jgi:hypothetical protein
VCDFKERSWGYSCGVENSPFITTKHDREVSEVQGHHLSQNTASNVIYFECSARTVFFFPRGLTKFFRNIERIHFGSGHLKKITKEDLMQFGDRLKRLDIRSNDFEYVEGDLFDFNPNLELIILYDNKIKHFDYETFTGLQKLKTLELHSNPCTVWADHVSQDRSKVLQLILDINAKCKDLSLANFILSKKVSQQISSLAKLVETQNEKIQNLEVKFNLQNLEVERKIENFCKKTEETSA